MGSVRSTVSHQLDRAMFTVCLQSKTNLYELARIIFESCKMLIATTYFAITYTILMTV